MQHLMVSPSGRERPCPDPGRPDIPCALLASVMAMELAARAERLMAPTGLVPAIDGQ
jgi:hypothetical protein